MPDRVITLKKNPSFYFMVKPPRIVGPVGHVCTLYMYMCTCIHVYSTASPTTGNKTDLMCNHYSYLDTRLREFAEWFVVQWLKVTSCRNCAALAFFPSPSNDVTILPRFVCCPHWRYFAIQARKRILGCTKNTPKSPFVTIYQKKKLTTL